MSYFVAKRSTRFAIAAEALVDVFELEGFETFALAVAMGAALYLSIAGTLIAITTLAGVTFGAWELWTAFGVSVLPLLTLLVLRSQVRRARTTGTIARGLGNPTVIKPCRQKLSAHTHIHRSGGA